MSPSRASRSSAGTSSATVSRSAVSSCSTSSSGTTSSARGTSSPVQSTISGVGCTAIVARKLHGADSLSGSSKSYSGAVTGRSRALRCGAPEPAADVGLDRLDPEAILADVSEQHRAWDLPLPEARDLDRAGEVGGGMLDRMLELGRGNLDGEADSVVRELFDHGHGGHCRGRAMPGPRRAGGAGPGRAMPGWRRSGPGMARPLQRAVPSARRATLGARGRGGTGRRAGFRSRWDDVPWRFDPSRPHPMQAVVFTGAGGPEVVSVQERPDPAPGPEEVVVRVAFAGLNPADLHQRAGHYPAPPGSPPDIPGLEVAGRVESCGERVTDWVPGDRVLGLVGGGGLAERVLVHQRLLARVPERLTDEEAAATPEAFVTAHDAIRSQASLTMGELLVVHGAAGGVGTAAVQLGLLAGAEVVGTVRSEASAAAVTTLGGDGAGRRPLPRGAASFCRRDPRARRRGALSRQPRGAVPEGAHRRGRGSTGARRSCSRSGS